MMGHITNPQLKKVFCERKVYDENGKEHDWGGSVSEEEAQALYSAVLDKKATNSVEVGMAYGISSLAILLAIKELDMNGTHHVIDPFQDHYHNIGLTMVERSEVKNYMKFHKKFPEEVIPSLENLDFAFIDSSHLFDNTVMEFLLVDKKLKVGGLVGMALN